jgi:hypothetical protein
MQLEVNSDGPLLRSAFQIIAPLYVSRAKTESLRGKTRVDEGKIDSFGGDFVLRIEDSHLELPVEASRDIMEPFK